MSVDGTDFQLEQGYVKAFWLRKFKRCGLRYELALNIKTGNIVWWNGPFEPGLYNDNMSFQMGLAGQLEDGEHVEADDGYKHSSPEWVKCPGTVAANAETAEMQANVCLRHEACNECLRT